MRKLFGLEPEVAGGWGPATVITNRRQIENGSETIPRVTFLEYRFDGWLGDDLLTFWSTFIVTEVLSKALTKANLLGIRFEPLAVSTSDMWEEFRQFKPSVRLPTFKRLIPEGQATIRATNEVASWSGHDVCWGTRGDFVNPKDRGYTLDTPSPYCLVVTDRCLDVLKQYHLEHCDIQELIGHPRESEQDAT